MTIAILRRRAVPIWLRVAGFVLLLLAGWLAVFVACLVLPLNVG